MTQTSVYQLLGLPDAFGQVLLVVALVLALVPFAAGKDFGVLKVPTFSAARSRTLRWLGPAVLLLVVALFVPLVPGPEQDRPPVTGVVVFADGLPAESLVVVALGWSASTTTDAQGAFKLDHPLSVPAADSVALRVGRDDAAQWEVHRVAVAAGQLVTLRRGREVLPDSATVVPAAVTEVLRKLQLYTDFQTDTATIGEAVRMLRAVGSTRVAASETAVTATVGMWQITLWPRSHNRPKVFGVRYQPMPAGRWDAEATYHEITIPTP